MTLSGSLPIEHRGLAPAAAFKARENRISANLNFYSILAARYPIIEPTHEYVPRPKENPKRSSQSGEKKQK